MEKNSPNLCENCPLRFPVYENSGNFFAGYCVWEWNAVKYRCEMIKNERTCSIHD